jgi:hypothetical protein
MSTPDSGTEFTKRRPGPKINLIYAHNAVQLYDNGYSPLPLTDKEPRIASWQTLFCNTSRPSLEAIKSEHSLAYRGGIERNGIGVACYNGLTVVDVDSTEPEIVERLRRIISEINMAPACVGQRGFKAFFRAADGLNHQDWNIASRATGGDLEVLAHHRQAVVPPTVHPNTGAPYRWRDDECTLFNRRIDELPLITTAQIGMIRADFGIEKIKAKLEVKHTERRTERQRVMDDAERFNGNDIERARYLEAFRFVHPNDHATLVEGGMAISHYSRGEEWGFEWWRAWAGGGEFLGIRYTGSPKHDPAIMRGKWQSFREEGARSIRMGTIIRRAQDNGWDARLKRWGLSTQESINAATKLATDTAFGRAAAAMPKGDLFHQAREALRLHADDCNVIGRNAMRVLGCLLYFVNHEHGYAWPSYRRLANWLRMSERDVMRAITKLERAGYVIRSARYHTNPQGGRGTCFAVCPPGGLPWADIIAWARLHSGHDEATAWYTTPSTMPAGEHDGGSDETLASAYGKAQGRECDTQAATQPEAQARASVGRSYPTPGTHYHQNSSSAAVGVPDNGVMPDDTPATHENRDDAFLSDLDGSIDKFPDHDGMPLDPPPAFQARTATAWIASAAIPEFIGDICRKGIDLKAMQHLIDVLDFARAQGIDDAGLYEAIEIASDRAAYRGRDNASQPLNSLAPGAALTKLRRMLVRVLGDEFNAKHRDYERLKQRSNEARARRMSQDGAKPSKPAVNAYAAAQGRRDPLAADDSSDPDAPPF